MTINSLCLLTNEDLPLVLRVVGDVEGPILQLVLRPRQSDRMETILRHIHISVNPQSSLMKLFTLMVYNKAK